MEVMSSLLLFALVALLPQTQGEIFVDLRFDANYPILLGF